MGFTDLKIISNDVDLYIEQSVQDAPELSLISTETDSATLSYTNVINATEYEYELDGADPVSIGTTKPFSIFNLDQNTSYSIRLRGLNEQNTGPWSEAFQFQTKLAAPSDAPVISNIVASENTLTVHYTEVDRATYYEYRVNGGAPVSIDTENPFVLTLDYDTNYDVEVRGANNTGEGPWSNVYNISTELSLEQQVPQSAPAIASIDTTSTEAEISYGGVTAADSYEYRLNGGSVVNIGTLNPFTISNLDPDTTYNFEIRARNEHGPGPWSDVTQITTKVLAPEEAPVITNIDVTKTSAIITYDVAATATSYEFEVTQVGGQGEIKESADNPYTFTDLSPGTDYFIRMRGKNAGGVGPWSDSSVFTTGIEPQTAPTISVTPGYTTAEVSRNDVDGADSYEYRLDLSSSVDVGLDNPFTISGLTGETQYNLEVRATNEFGNGPWSATVSFTTTTPPPVAGNNGEITFTDITTSGFTANWDEATDPNYTHAQLTYTVYSSNTGNIDTIENAEANGTVEVSSTGITSYEFTNLEPETGKFVVVVVENPDELKDIYQMTSEVTDPEPEVITPSGTVSGVSIKELSQSFEITFDDSGVTEAFGYDIQFSDVGGSNASLHDIGLPANEEPESFTDGVDVAWYESTNIVKAKIWKSGITSYAQTKTLENRIRAYADEDGDWSSTINITTATEGEESQVVEIQMA